MPKNYPKPYARSRSRASIPVEAFVHVDFTKPNLPDAQHGPFEVSSELESISDWVVPGFRARVARGEVFNYPCVYTRSTVAKKGDGHGLYRKNDGSTIYTHDGPITQLRGISPGQQRSAEVDSASLESRCKLAALSRIDSTEYAFGEDVLEIRETIRFLRNPASAFLDLGKAFRRAVLRRQRSGEDLVNASANAWLTYRFAVTPLVRSMIDVVDVVTSKEKPLPVRRTARYKQKVTSSDYGNFSVVSGGNTYGGTSSMSVEEEGHAAILYELPSVQSGLRYRLGLRPKDIPVTVWAVMPLSFMVDRVVDVSGFIQAVTNLADPAVKILSASYRKKTTIERKAQLLSHTFSGWSNQVQGEERISTSFSYVRSPWQPTVADAVPTLDLSGLVSDSTKILDLIALGLSFWRLDYRR